MPGEHALHLLSPSVLELSLVTQSPPPAGQPVLWNFLDPEHGLHLPPTKEFKVTVDGHAAAIRAVGFKRRPVYAPLKQRDLRLGNYLYLELTEPVRAYQTVEVTNPDGTLWPATMRFTVRVEPLRFSPAIHVNQTGYLASGPKQAMIGFYLGSLGELDVTASEFELRSAETGRVVYHGQLQPRPDQGFPYPWYQKVKQADFSDFREPGEYRLVVPGLGVSYPFFIDDSIAGTFARTFALGLYHQRCGVANALPYTRFTHAACHTAPAEVPTPEFKMTQEFLKGLAAESPKNPRQTAPPLTGVEASLYPSVHHGKIDVSGGHHDAGDYNKYTVNSAGLIHYLVFAADTFPGVAALDNLGLPESGNGKSDVLEEAKWEADFLVKMQDDDGGFYFLVYPRDRKYENDVLPDHGDPQVVWPKTTTATAAAVAALAECGSSPEFKREFPQDAARYLAAALRGWKFLSEAIARHSKDGSYQQLTHEGAEFMHDDELAWAAAAMFAATGDRHYEEKLRTWLDPRDAETRRWGWWRMCASYGCAIRSYAFAARSGRLKPAQLDHFFLKLCEDEIVACAEDWLHAARQSAYGVSFPEQTKHMLGAGWYFATDPAFDLAVASQLDFPPRDDRRPRYHEAILSNLNYSAGCNPVNVCYIAGLGWHRPREVVHNYAQNDRRALPPTGLLIGNIQDGFGWMEQYQRELGFSCFPLDGDKTAPYPMYDRWGDSFNLETEATTLNEARALAVAAWLMAQTPLRTQAWQPLSAEITGLPQSAAVGRPITAMLKISPPLDLHAARIVWEASGKEPAFGSTFTFTPHAAGQQWIEVEAQWPDGRRAFGAAEFQATSE